MQPTPQERKDTSVYKPVAFVLFLAVVAGSLFLVFGKASSTATAAPVSVSGKWTCSMDPQFVLPEPGKCPKCFMDLIPLAEGAYGGGKRELILPPEAAALAGITGAAVEKHDLEGDTSELTIPATAVLQNLGRAFVFVETEVEGGLSFVMREIELGPRKEGRRVVASGLEEGERVAASGLFRIDSAMQILGKVSLANLPDGDLAAVDEEEEVPPFQPAERSALNLRGDGLALDEWFREYEQIRAALAKDDFGGASPAARKLRDALHKVPGDVPGEFKELYAGLAKDADGMAQATELAARRAAFDRLSADMVLLARRYGSPSGGLNLVFCPMAFGGRGAHWLQPGETVDNPYHGLEMPRCGWLVESIDGGKAAEKGE